MSERDDFNLDDIFAEVGSVLKGELSSNPTNGIESDTESEEELLKRYSKTFISQMYLSVSKGNDPSE